MITVDEALALVMEQARPLAEASCSLIDSRGCRLCEDIVADADQPPFDKALVDGFALRIRDLHAGQANQRLRIGETILAGQTPSRPLAAGEAAVIMTGIPSLKGPTSS